MELSAEEYINGLFSKEAFQRQCDDGKPEDLTMTMPEWFDEKQYNKGRRFYWKQCYAFTTSMALGLVALFAVPSIIQVLICSRRSSSNYTAYRRYISTLLHTITWFEHDLKPGSKSWRSLHTVRIRHIKASMAANMKNKGIVSQRDLAITQFAFIGFSILKPDKLGIRQLEEGDWEAYNHFWRVIGHAIGIEDRYNLCRSNIEQTRQVCQIVLDRLFTPCLANVPEYFEHMARVMLNGIWCFNPTINVDAIIYWTKYLAGVPGYIDTEEDRINLQKKLRDKLMDKSEECGVDICALMAEPLLQLPVNTRRLYLHDYDIIEKVPPYHRLSLAGRYKLTLSALLFTFNSSSVGRIILSWMFTYITLPLIKYFPYMAFFRFGVINSYARIFREDPTDNEEPIPNCEYEKPQPPQPLYKEILGILW